MTDAQLEALAVYRRHKFCQCQDCETARRILKEQDEQKWNGGARDAKSKTGDPE